MSRARSARNYVLLGGVIAGVLDITYAIVFFGLRGVPPIRIFQSIASGLMGRAAYSGGLATAGLGGVLHFLIAITAAATFYAVSRRFPWLVRNAVPAGIVFGLCVYAFMNFVVVPLSAFPHEQKFPPLVLTTGLLIHMFGIGLPIALCVRAGSRQPEGSR